MAQTKCLKFFTITVAGLFLLYLHFICIALSYFYFFRQLKQKVG